MLRRNLFGGLAALAAVLALVVAVPARAEDKPDPHQHAEHFMKCAKACGECSLQCASCHHHCAHLVVEGKKDHAKTMSLCNDCALICGAAAIVSGRHGPLAVTLCESCAKACDTCGAACAKFPDDKHMAECAKACRDCATACREMTKHAAH